MSSLLLYCSIRSINGNDILLLPAVKSILIFFNFFILIIILLLCDITASQSIDSNDCHFNNDFNGFNGFNEFNGFILSIFILLS